WIKRVNQALAGQVSVKYLGGPEVVPGFEQIEACRNGVVDVVFAAGSYYEPILPEIVATLLSKVSVEEELKPGGFYDYMVKAHEKIGIRSFGRWLYNPFYLFFTQDAKNLDDLKGRKMRSGRTYDRMMKELGMTPVTIGMPDVYTALERGTVDGLGWSIQGPNDFGWTEKAKYVLDIPFYVTQNTLVLMNLSVWNGLTKEQQEKIVAIDKKFQPDVITYFTKEIAKEWEKLDKAGVKRIEFSAADKAKFLEVTYSQAWAGLEEKVKDPAEVKALKRLTGN
ncbi:MAG TPA: TRAP transporter substrate-binding protein DctP, partial [Deferrisomatales bacterium]|nr:TRAP transporter substrate-binding protein DctP [Deferrisomatales bacterium]